MTCDWPQGQIKITWCYYIHDQNAKKRDVISNAVCLPLIKKPVLTGV